MMFLADGIGIPIVKGNPLPKPVREWILSHENAVICGTVQKCEDTEYSKSLILKNSYLMYQSKEISIENIKVYMKENAEVPVGAFVVVSGRLEETKGAQNPGGFDSAAYYACQHIYYLMKSAVLVQSSDTYSKNGQMLSEIQRKLSSILDSAAGEAAPVFQAMLLGNKTNLEKETKTLYQMSGIIHILAISGLHISMLGLGLYKILKKLGFGMYGAGFLAFFIMIEYGMMTGSSVSAIRAICMFLMSVGAQMLGRSYDMPTALALSAVLILMESPAYLYNSSFQLSFGAVIGIGVVVPVVLEILPIQKKWGQNLLSSFTVQMVTLPIVLYTYGEVSLAGIFLNLLVLPTVGVVLGSGLAGCAVGSLGGLAESIFTFRRGLLDAGIWTDYAAKAAVLPGRILLWIYEKVCTLVTGFSLSVWIAGAPKIWQILLYYLLMAGMLALGVFLGKKQSRAEKNKVRTGIQKKGFLFIKGSILGGFLAVMLLVLTIRFRDDLRIVCLDVGQGDCAVISTKEGRHFLVDSGSTDQSKVGEYCLMPFLKNQGIAVLDGIFISHTDKDHMNGIEELLTTIGKGLTAIRVKNVILPDWEVKEEAYVQLEKLAQNAGANVIYANAGDCFQAEKLTMKILHPQAQSTGKDTNEEGIVLEVTYGGFCGLFMGDVGSTVEKELLSVFGEVDFLKVGHHGSKYSTCEEFLGKIKADFAVISCGKDNSYGHPHKETLERLEAAECEVWNTAEKGYAVIKVD